MKVNGLGFVVFLVLELNKAFGQQLNVTRTYPVGLEGANPLVTAAEDAKNVTVLCELTLDETVLRTQWSFITDSVTLLAFTEDGGGQKKFMSSPNSDFRRNLTILTFNSSFDNTQIGCGVSGMILVRFDLKLIRLPLLLLESVAQNVTEGNKFAYNIESTPGFPIVPEFFEWSFENDILQNSSSIIVSNYPNITFINIGRNNSGNYSVIAINEAGSAVGFFVLDVQYGPEGSAQNGPQYVKVGGNLTIVGYKVIGGNPKPTSTWTFNGSVVSGSRFNELVLGQLTISSALLSDSGNYTNTLMNTVVGNSMSIKNTIELFVVDPPSMPRNISLLEIGAESVNIMWVDPTNIGTPAFDQLRIDIISSFSVTNLTVKATNNLRVEGLEPSTQYSLTIRALSTVEQLVVLVSEPSEALVFNTSIGVPRFLYALLNSTDGNLSVSWKLLHTGGIELETIIVQCSEDENEDYIGYTTINTFKFILNCLSATVDCLVGSVSLGPVRAGVNYICTVTAENRVGIDEYKSNIIMANTGIPSQPVIMNVSSGSESATITLRVDSFGVSVASDFTFVVSVFSPSDTTNPAAVRMITSDSIDSPIVTIVVEGLSKGTYLFTVTSSNIFSPPFYIPSLSSQVFVEQRPITISRSSSSISCTNVIQATSTTNCSSSSSIGLSGGIIGGIVIAILLLLAVIGQFLVFLLFFVYKTKVIKEVNKSSKQELSAIQLTDLDADYKDIDRVYDQPEQSETIGMKKNIAYGEVKTGK